ncbi:MULTISPECIES: Scr1 family TA system antitoxin-like transcriptional regulator [Amycolatopsis]|uniref:DNA-binding protein n=2 Tax=Amycolatopsis TaxID=1813 RepID=A0A229S4H6_9PSEU|nr:MULTISPECIES: Scr1 family TA system antitoxin-like transcriptional regulator [Amycolatopsis]AXB41318.1 DNA-binding protein [Amycolatopsis albispora]OXM53790.1 DNA-binding protein [Amycolatopsis thailandensis]
MPATVRTAKKLLLGREIAHMIETAGASQAEAAKLIETSQPRMASLISGGSNIAPGDLVLLATKLGFTDEGYQEALRELRRDNHKRGFWTTGHNRAYSEDIRLRVDLDKHADQLRGVEVEVAPGLLQCESYVRALHADMPEINGVTLDDRIAARLARQDILAKDEPPLLQFVLSESCVRRVWGDAGVMLEQVEHMIELSNRPNVHIQVMPFDQPAGRRSPIASPFTLIRVPSPGAAGPLELAYVEGEAEIRYLDDRKALRAYETAWARLSNAALKFDETRDFLRGVADDYRAAA